MCMNVKSRHEPGSAGSCAGGTSRTALSLRVRRGELGFEVRELQGGQASHHMVFSDPFAAR